MYELVKGAHMGLALLSISGFVFRGTLALKDNEMRHQKWLKIVPHIVDSGLLIAAISLVWQLSINPLDSAWLMTKIVALIVYILLGTQVIKQRGSPRRQKTCFVLALLTFAYMVTVAMSKSPTLGL